MADSHTRIPVAEGVALDVLVRRAATDDAVPFVLVHGLSSNARLWDGVGERLRERGHSSAALDQRGHGHSDKPESGYDFATVTARCNEAQRLQEVGPDEQKRDAFEPSDLLETVVRERYSTPSFTPWLQNVDIQALPVVPDDRPR